MGDSQERFTGWNYFIACGRWLCDFVMRLMGRSKLAKLAQSEAEGMSSAAAALCAELEEACWNSPASIARAYPRATVNGQSVRIPIGAIHCVDLLVQYEMEMVVVVFADVTAKAPGRRRAKGGQSA